VGGQFTLDATSESACNRVPAELHYTDNALNEVWLGKTFLHLTPDMAIDEWIAKLAAQLEVPKDPVTECILLLPAITDADWFAHLASLDTTFVFSRRRLVLYGTSQPCSYPHAVAYAGSQHDTFARFFSSLGPAVRSAGHPTGQERIVK
jgi:hypothetical protein